MALIADGMLILAALAASIYCFALSRRLRRLTGLKGGLGDAISTLSERVDEMNAALEQAKTSSSDAAAELDQRSMEARAAADRIERALDRMAEMRRLEDEREAERQRLVDIAKRKESEARSVERESDVVDGDIDMAIENPPSETAASPEHHESSSAAPKDERSPHESNEDGSRVDAPPKAAVAVSDRSAATIEAEDVRSALAALTPLRGKLDDASFAERLIETLEGLEPATIGRRS